MRGHHGRPALKPTPSHPITITPADGELSMNVGDREVARASGTTTHCPYRGEASHRPEGSEMIATDAEAPVA